MIKLYSMFKWVKKGFKFSKKRRIKIARKFLQGNGIEIGALNNPMDLNNSKIKKIVYVDNWSIKDLLKQYPELANFKIIEPDIIDDAEVLKKINNNYYDFIIANHVIEHMENPIKAIATWLSKIKKGGIIFMAVPDKKYTFDKNKKETTWKHFLKDHLSNDLSVENYNCHSFNFSKIFPSRGKILQEQVGTLKNNEGSVHYHYWTHNGFEKFLNKCQKKLFLNFTIISSSPPIPFGIESLFVLKKI